MSFKHCVLIFIFSNERWSQTWWGSLRSVRSCNKASDFDDITLAWKDGSWLAVKCESGYCHFKQLVLWKWRTSPIFFFVFFMNFLLLCHLLWQMNEFILCLSGISIVSPLVMKSFGQHWTMDNGQPIRGATIATRAPCTDLTVIYRNQYLPRVPVSAFFHLLIAGLMEPVDERVCCQKTLFLICQLPQKSHSSKIFQMDYNVDQVILWAY